MHYTPILGTLSYIMSKDKEEVLLLHRNKRPDDQYWGKYIGLGGKLESTEDIITGMKREVMEESGLECKKIVLCGTINWLSPQKIEDSWLGFIFRVDSYEGNPLYENPEGALKWVKLPEIYNLPMSVGDKKFLPMLFQNEQQFHGVMIRENDRVLSWTYNLIHL